MSCGSSNVTRAALVALVVAIAPRLHGAGVLAEPANVYLSAAAGTVVDPEIALSSLGGESTATVTLSAFTIDDHGQPRSCACKMSRSLVPWGDVSAQRLVLVPGKRNTVAVHLTVPANAEGSYWGVVLIETTVTPQGSTKVRPRLAIPLFVTVRGTERPALRFSALHAYRSADKSIVVEGTIVNAGNTVLRAPLLIAIESGDTVDAVERGSLEIPTVIVLPGVRRTFRLEVNGDFAGVPDLSAAAFVRFGNEPSAVAEGACLVASARPCTAPCAGV